MLGRAFESRLENDYDVSSSTQRTEAEEVLRDAQLFVDRAKHYLMETGIL